MAAIHSLVLLAATVAAADDTEQPLTLDRAEILRSGIASKRGIAVNSA